MSNVIAIAAAGVRAGAAYPNPAPIRPVKPASLPDTVQSVDPAMATVNVIASKVAYTASLDTLRTANKMMMGYLLNIKV